MDYKEQKHNRIRNKYRILLGLRQLVNYPVINLIWLIYGVGIYILYKFKTLLISFNIIEFNLGNIISGILDVSIIIIIIFSPIAILHIIGELFARNDESNISLALNENSLIKKYPPILVYKKTKKKTGVTTRVFYTVVSKRYWEDKADAISDRLNICILNGFSYGGRKGNNGNLVKFDSTNNRTPIQRLTIKSQQGNQFFE